MVGIEKHATPEQGSLVVTTNPREIGRNTYSKAVFIHALNVSSAEVVIDVVIAVNLV